MRAVGLDIGSVRIGVAVSDSTGTVAMPRTQLDAVALWRDPTPLKEIVEEVGAEVLVIGLPVTLSGEEGPQARAVREAGERLAREMGVPAVYVDERLTTAQAAAAMRAQGRSTRQQRGGRDVIAATVLLQTYLESQRSGASDE